MDMIQNYAIFLNEMVHTTELIDCSSKQMHKIRFKAAKQAYI